MALDRVQERRRAAALARHYRDVEGLSIAEIARRLGRAEGTVKAYLYDPSGAKAREVKARYRGVCRGCGAPTSARNGKGDAYAYCKRCRPGRSRANGPASGSVMRCAPGERATALRRPRMTGRAPTRAGAAAKRSNEYRPENGPAASTVIDLYG
ncbi:MAG TPA: sigma-70 region 4 domain-containing protein, partial [Candidatus Dormibacteraeota bacterium]|nr:sigma-70 region 4 domain-containing protein [Candidatus Dormibacteraeota bacterium]